MPPVEIHNRTCGHSASREWPEWPPARLTACPPAGIYLHWPFCLSRCTYCDFVTAADRPGQTLRYSQALLQEIDAFDPGQSAELVLFDTLYWGGGTPSLIPADVLEAVHQACRNRFNLSADLEITLEVNPGTLDRAKAERFRGAGVNRISLGLESFHDNELAALNRRHDVRQAIDAYETCRNAGFDNISIDLICGLPHQSAAQWRATLEQAVQMAPEHISVYLLELHRGTRLSRQVQSGAVPLPEDEEAIAGYALCIDLLEAAGYEQYEISNFARQRRYSRHNLKYWSDQPCLGFGVGSHYCFGGIRYENASRLEEYLLKVRDTGRGLCQQTRLSFRRWLGDYAITVLRLRQGLGLADFKTTYGFAFEDVFQEEISRLADWGLIETAAGRLRLTRKALAVSNAVFMEFI